MITGTVRQDRAKWFIEYTTTRFNEPVAQRFRWLVTGARTIAPYGPAPELADGLEVTSDTGRPWQAYEHGNYLVLETEENGIIEEDSIPAPKVRAGTATRYHNGRWEKLTRGDWRAA